MKYIFIGDIHGKVDQVKRALDMDGMKIFVGDFMDSFDRPYKDHAECLDLVLDACSAGVARAIYGNHELSYLMPRIHRCSGYTVMNQLLMQSGKSTINSLFEPYILLTPEFLVSHAGLTKQLWNDAKLTVESLPDTLDKWWPDEHSPMHGIGYSRGGRQPYGGLFWCDFNREFEPVSELTQVFGHTAGKGIRVVDEKNWCIDCLDNEHSFLEMEI